MSRFLLSLALALAVAFPALATYCPYNRMTSSPSHSALAESARAGLDPHLVSVVVPVYRELENGNIVRFLQSFTGQGAHANQFELVTIVNNTPEVAAAKDPVFQENQRTLALLKYAARETDTPPDFFATLPEWQRKAIEQVRKRGLQIRVVDLSTEGVERNMGLIRDTGVRQAMDAHQDREANHIVAMMDADTLVNPGYIENIAAHFGDPKLNLLSLDTNYRVEAGSSPYVYQSTFAYRYNPAASGLRGAARLAGSGGGGPQTITRAANYKKVGGYMHIPLGEDGYISQELMALGNYRTPHDVQIFIGDRYRPDGYDALYRSGTTKFEAKRDFSLTRDMLVSALDAYFRKHGKISPAEAKRYFDYFAIPFDAANWGSRFDDHGKHKDKGLHKNAYFTVHVGLLLDEMPKSGKPVEELQSFLDAKLAPPLLADLQKRIDAAEASHNASIRTLRDTVKKLVASPDAFDPARRQFSDPMVDEFLSGNNWIAGRVREAKAKGENAEQILAGLEKDFPDWFLPFASTPLKREVDTITVMRDFLRESTFHAERHPSFRKLTQVFEGNLPN